MGVNPADMPRIPTLPPRIGSLPPRLASLTTATTRTRGDAWMRMRRDTLVEHAFTCAACGRVRLARHLDIDHRVPLEQGGTDDPGNRQPLCNGPGECHAQKTKADAEARRSGYPGGRAPALASPGAA